MPEPNSPIADDEIIVRHVPEIAISSHVASSNFELRPGETYVSVCRESITSATAMLKVVKTTQGSCVVAARVGDVRALGLKVEPHPSKRLPGHAGIETGIESGSASLDDELTRMKLAEVFTYLDPSAYQIPHRS